MGRNFIAGLPTAFEHVYRTQELMPIAFNNPQKMQIGQRLFFFWTDYFLAIALKTLTPSFVLI